MRAASPPRRARWGPVLGGVLLLVAIAPAAHAAPADPAPDPTVPTTVSAPPTTVPTGPTTVPGKTSGPTTTTGPPVSVPPGGFGGPPKPKPGAKPEAPIPDPSPEVRILLDQVRLQDQQKIVAARQRQLASSSSPQPRPATASTSSVPRSAGRSGPSPGRRPASAATPWRPTSTPARRGWSSWWAAATGRTSPARCCSPWPSSTRRRCWPRPRTGSAPARPRSRAAAVRGGGRGAPHRRRAVRGRQGTGRRHRTQQRAGRGPGRRPHLVALDRGGQRLHARRDRRLVRPARRAQPRLGARAGPRLRLRQGGPRRGRARRHGLRAVGARDGVVHQPRHHPPEQLRRHRPLRHLRERLRVRHGGARGPGPDPAPEGLRRRPRHLQAPPGRRAAARAGGLLPDVAPAHPHLGHQPQLRGEAHGRCTGRCCTGSWCTGGSPPTSGRPERRRDRPAASPWPGILPGPSAPSSPEQRRGRSPRLSFRSGTGATPNRRRPPTTANEEVPPMPSRPSSGSPRSSRPR